MLWKDKFQACDSPWNRNSFCCCGSDIGKLLLTEKSRSIEVFSKKHEASIESDLPSQGYLDRPELSRKYFGVQRQYCFRCNFLFRKPRRCLVSVVRNSMVFHKEWELSNCQPLPLSPVPPASMCSALHVCSCVIPLHVPTHMCLMSLYTFMENTFHGGEVNVEVLIVIAGEKIRQMCFL